MSYRCGAFIPPVVDAQAGAGGGAKLGNGAVSWEWLFWQRGGGRGRVGDFVGTCDGGKLAIRNGGVGSNIGIGNRAVDDLAVIDQVSSELGERDGASLDMIGTNGAIGVESGAALKRGIGSALSALSNLLLVLLSYFDLSMMVRRVIVMPWSRPFKPTACLQGQENDVLLGAQTDIPVDFFAVVAQSDNESNSIYYKKLWVGKLR